MIDPIVTIVIALAFLAVGYVVGDDRRKPTTLEDIKPYIETHFPNEWQAYQKGIREGYEQALRDCQEEPT